jgi:DNA topoisomerase-1
LSASADGSVDIGTKKLGMDPQTGLDVTVRSGRFGPYVQLGETVDGQKPKRAGLPKGAAPDEIDLARALALLSLPREVGRHPEDGEPIRAGIGRFGPYVQHGKTYANLDSPEEVFTVGLNRAVTLIAEKIAKGPRKGRFGGDPGRPLGDHPQKGGGVVAKKGRYGPYVSHDGINATLPSDKTPESITLDEAVALIDARAERNPPAPHRPRKGKRAAPGAARAGKRTAAKRPPSSEPAKPPAAKTSRRKATQAAE